MATFKQYTASGGATENFSIKSFAKEEIYVRVDGVLKTAGTHYNITNYTANGGTVTWVTSPTDHTPSSGTVRIYRITDLDPAQATFAAGSSIKADDLNNNQEQVLRALREENDQLVQTWDIEDNAITTAKIKDLEITNADISASAEIAVSKLADGSARQVLQTASNGSDVEWTSNVDIPGTLDVTSSAAFDSNVTISGNSTVGGTLGVTGTTTAAAINASGAVGVDGNFDVNTNKFTVASSTGNTTIAGTLGVTGTTTAAAINASGAVGVDGNFDVNTNKFTVAASSGNTVIGGDLDVQGNFEVTGTSLHTGQQTVPGGAQVKNIKVGLDAPNEVSTTSGNLVLDSASGTVQITDHFNVTGNADVDTNLNVDGTLTVDGTSTLTGNTSIGGTLTVTGTTNLAANSIGRAEIANDAIDGTKIDDNAINSEHYVDGSIDRVHLEADIIDGSKLADNACNSEHYTDSSIDSVHLSDNAVTTVKIGDNQVTAAKIDDSVIVTNSEQGSHTANDTTFYTTAASDARYYNIGSLEEITSGETWAADDAKIATTAAIDARIVDLVDDVGGFVPIANETSFPNANPDVNNGAGTLVSIKALASNLVSNGSGVATISNGTVGNSTVTINGLAASTTYPAGRGILVETTTTLNTYTFHRQLAEATATTTVANNISNVNTCATNISNINAVAADATDIGVVAGKETEIGRLGTADAVADMNTLATTAIVADLETCADNNANISTTAGAISNVNTVAGSISNVNTTAGAISNVNTTAGAIANVNNVGNNIANVNTVGSNIGTVNDFAARYRGPQNNAGEYTSSLDVGDLYFNTTINALKVYTGSGWVAGVTQTGDYALKTGSTYTGNNTHNDGVKSRYGTGNDLEIYHTGTNAFLTNTAGYMLIDAQGASNDLVLRAGNDVLLQPKNGENGVKVIGDGAVELYHDGNLKINTASYGTQVANGNLRVGDGNSSDNTYGRIQLGTSQDLQIWHSGSASYIEDYGPGDLIIRASDQLKIQEIDNGETMAIFNKDGAAELYFDNVKRFETTTGGAKITGNGMVTGDFLVDSDSGKLKLGLGEDLQIYHSGSHSYLLNSGTGNLYIQDNDYVEIGRTDEAMLGCVGNGAVKLYYDGSNKLETRSDGIIVSGNIQLNDGNRSDYGNNGDLKIYHSSGDNNSYIHESGSGHLVIKADDLYIQNSAGSQTNIKSSSGGAVELSHAGTKKLETTSTGISVSGDIDGIPDGSKILVGTHDDMQLYHTSNSSYIKASNHTIHLDSGTTSAIRIISGGSTTYGKMADFNTDGSVDLYYDNTKKFETNSGGVQIHGHAQFDDSKYIKLGTGDDVQIFHNGSNFHVQHLYSGSTYIDSCGNHNFRNSAGTENRAIFANNGAVQLYYDNSKKFETASYGVKISGHLYGDDGNQIRLGSSQDLELYHDGNHSYLKNSTGSLHIAAGSSQSAGFTNNAANAWLIRGIDSGAAELYYNGNKKLETTNNGGTLTGDWFMTTNGYLSFPDGVQALFGTSSDLKIYHDGSHSRIKDTGTGNLALNSSKLTVYNAADNEAMIIATENESVDLYHNGGIKFQTRTGGAYVYGKGGGTTFAASQAMHANDRAGFEVQGELTGIKIASTYNDSSHPDYGLVFVQGPSTSSYNAWSISPEGPARGNNLNFHYQAQSSNIHVNTNCKVYMTGNGDWVPNNDNSSDLGTSSKRWRNVYTYDLNLSNEGSQNDVDGTWGSWTIQEGQDDLFLLNRRNGKKYKFNLTEVS